MIENNRTAYDMVRFSGKGINQFGIYDSCSDSEYLHFVVVGTTFVTTKLPAVNFGLCLPKNCDNQDYFEDLLIKFEAFINRTQSENVTAYISFPNLENKEPISSLSWLIISLLCVLLLLLLIGTITHFTILFDDTSYTKNEREVMNIEDKKTLIGKFFYCFSPVYSISRIFKTDNIKDDDLNVLCGLKVASMCFIIVGTSFLYIIYVPISNIESINELFKNPLFGLIPSSIYGIDVFFYITGILVFSSLTKKMYHDIETMSISWLYLRKIYRSLLPLILVIGITSCIFPYLGDGPFYKYSWNPLIENCDKYWWANLLFINNLIPWSPEKLCLPWLYYLASDMQYFLLSPPIIYLYCRNKKLAYWVLAGFIASTMIYMIFVTVLYDLPVQLIDDDHNMLGILLTKPWCAWNSYFIGAVVGLSYFELKYKNDHPELKNSIFNRIYSILEKSNRLLFGCFIMGTFLLCIYVFPLGDYRKACVFIPK